MKNKVEGVISIGVNVNRGGRKEGEETADLEKKPFFLDRQRGNYALTPWHEGTRGEVEKGTAYGGVEKIGRKITFLETGCPL